MKAGRTPTLGVLVLLAVAIWGVQYARRGLWEPDEARYAYVAREMRDDGRWFVPHLHGEPYPDKPPLLFWLINAGAAVAGGAINGLTARAPSLLGAVLALWVTARLAERWGGAAAAWRAVLVLGSAWLFWYEAGWGRTDALLVGLEMLSLYHLTVAAERSVLAGYVPAYLCAGLAVLAKGPIGLVVPMGIHAAMQFAAGTAERRAHCRWHWIWGPLLAAVLPGLWLAIAWLQAAPADYFGAMLGTKSFGRVLAAPDHGRPFYYHWVHFPVELLPWTFFLPAAWRGLGPGVVRRRLAAWIGFVLGLFSLFATKRSQYVLMAYPAAALLIALGWDGLRARSRRRGLAALTIGFVLVAGVAEFVASGHRSWPAASWVLWPAAVVLLAGGAWLGWLYLSDGFNGRWFAVFAGTWLVHHLILGGLALPAFNARKAPVALAAEARAWLPADQPVYLYRDQLAIVPLYVGRPGRWLRTPAELAAALERHERGVVVCSAAAWQELPADLTTRMVARPFAMGGKELVWAEFGPLAGAPAKAAQGEAAPSDSR